MGRLLTDGPVEGPARAPVVTPDNDSTPLGEFLRRARERRGLTLQEISRATRIPRRHLDALEQGNLAALPGGFYRRAEIRAYAEVVHLDQNLALARLERALAPAERKVVVPQTTTKAAPPRSSRTESLIAIGVVAAAFMFWLAVWGRTTAPDGSDQENTATSSQTPSASGAVNETARPAVLESSGPAPIEPAAVTSPSTDPSAATTPSSDPSAVAPLESETPQNPDAELIVTTEPAGARVTVDGIGWGVTPITIRHLSMGAKRVRVSKDGYVIEDRIVRMVGDRPSITVSISLRTTP